MIQGGCPTIPETAVVVAVPGRRVHALMRIKRKHFQRGISAVLALAILALVVAMGPLYVCMPPWVDSSFFDIIARSVLAHEAAYRQYLLHGPPGMLLVQSLFRWLIGWTSEALRLLDLCLVAGIVVWLAASVPPRRLPAVRLWTALVLAYFYFGATTEWSHCQTDTWMLVPSIAAFVIHKKRLLIWAARSGEGSRAGFASAFLEGVCWGIAFTMKPFVVCPAIGCWAITIVTFRKLGRSWRSLLGEFVALLGGGLAVGTATVAWLWVTGNWEPFVKAAFSDWNRDYWANSPRMIERPGLLLAWFWPWNLVHLVTVPASIAVVLRFCRSRRPVGQEIACTQLLLAAFYLGWFFQANVLQRQLPYHLMPTILIAIPLLFGIRWARFVPMTLLWLAERGLAPRHWLVPLIRAEPIVRWLLIGVFLAFTWTDQNGIRYRRLCLWTECWKHGSTPLMRAQLSLEADAAAPDWVELDLVRQFLAGQNLKDGELNCFAVSALSLYLDLNLKPGNPYVYGWGTVCFFRSHTKEIIASMMNSRERFIVNDYRHYGYSQREARQLDPRYPRGRLPVPSVFRHDFPLDYPSPWRFGRYLIHVPHLLEPAPGAPSIQGHGRFEPLRFLRGTLTVST